MFWHRTFTSDVSLISQPTDATSTGVCSGSAERNRHWPHGWRLSCQRMMTRRQWRVIVPLRALAQ